MKCLACSAECFQYLVTGEIVRLVGLSFIIINYRLKHKSDNMLGAELDDFALTFRWTASCKAQSCFESPAKVRIITQLCVSPAATCWTASRKTRATRFIILIHKQSLMFMAGVVTCLRQHYVCFTRPLSSQVFTSTALGGCEGTAGRRFWGV